MAFSDTLMQIVQLQALYCYQQSHEHMHSAGLTMRSAMSKTSHNTQGIYTDRAKQTSNTMYYKDAASMRWSEGTDILSTCCCTCASLRDACAAVMSAVGHSA